MQTKSLGEKPIVVIVGQTASGKSDLALKVAHDHGGEVIAADSRTIYKGMDVGTAKPTLQEQQHIKHYGLDLIEPKQIFSAAEFKRYASNVVKKIQEKNKLPIIVGGTGLYVDGYVYDFEFGNRADKELRRRLELLDINELKVQAEALGIDRRQLDFMNKRHLVRAIERGGMVQTRHSKPSNVLLIGLKIDKEQLDKRIKKRVDTMFNQGLVEEVRRLLDLYGDTTPGLLAPGYKAVKEYINGTISLEEAKELFIRYDRGLAKRQMTWFKRNPDIIWCSSHSEAEENVRVFLSQFATMDS
jgi:tRNA dimethylallyltransferase